MQIAVRGLSIFFVLFGTLIARAEKPADACYKILAKNFAAVGNESVDDLMSTLSDELPAAALAEFAQEAEKLFQDTDVHVSMVDYEFLGVSGQYATARVVQRTMTQGTGTDYRHNSALLPPWPDTEYVQMFRRDRGQWRLWLIGEQRPAGCADGKCAPVISTGRSVFR